MAAAGDSADRRRRADNGQVSSSFRRPERSLTVDRSTFHDKILGTTVWPAFYDGRAIVTRTYEDHIGGMSVEENWKRYNEAKAKEDGELLVTWS